VAQLSHQGRDELLALLLAELQPIARARQLPLQRRALLLQAGQRGADAGEVLGAGGQGGDEPLSPRFSLERAAAKGRLEFLAAKIQDLLGLPRHVAVAAVMPLGRSVKQLTKLKRKPVSEFAMRGCWGGAPLAC
jgi:hypothetical protein